MSQDEEGAVVRRFLKRCLDYARTEIARYEALKPLAQDELEELQLQEKLTRWHTYKAFTVHALSELDAGALAHWFEMEKKGE